MPAPSDLTIATNAVQRLVKEEGFYRAELVAQETKVKSLESKMSETVDVDSNEEFMLKQEVCSLSRLRSISLSLSLSLVISLSLVRFPSIIYMLTRSRHEQSKAVEETKAIFGPLLKRTAEAVAKLEEQIAISEGGSSTDSSERELDLAREALKRGQATLEKAE